MSPWEFRMRDETLWLLEVVVGASLPYDGWVPFWGLPDDDPEESGSCTGVLTNHMELNFCPHHMPMEMLVAELSELFERGDIAASLMGYDRWEPERLFVPSLDEIRSGLTRGRRETWLSYTLTPQGFERWEAFARPHWECFCARDTWGIGDGHLVGITAASAYVAERWMKSTLILIHQYSIGSETVDWSRATYTGIRPWKVFPCKTLPSGVRLVAPTVAESAEERRTFEEEQALEAEMSSLLEGISPWYEHSVRTLPDNAITTVQFGGEQR